MIFAGVVNVDEVLVVEGDGTHLVVGGGKHLDHVVPGLTILLVGQKLLPLGLQVGHSGVQQGQTALVQSVVGEIVPFEGLGVNLVHGGAGIGHGTHLVGVELFPPVQGGGDVRRHEHLTEEFSMVAARYGQTAAEVHNTRLLLRNYKKIVWLVECFPEFIATELAQPLESVDKLLARVEGELAFGNKKLDRKLASIEKTRMVLELVNDAISVLQKMPKGENMYQVIYLTYATQEDLTIDDILYRLNISRKKYYLLRDQAIALISIRLWTSADKDLAFWLELLYFYENRKKDGGEDN